MGGILCVDARTETDSHAECHAQSTYQKLTIHAGGSNVLAPVPYLLMTHPQWDPPHKVGSDIASSSVGPSHLSHRNKKKSTKEVVRVLPRPLQIIYY